MSIATWFKGVRLPRGTAFGPPTPLPPPERIYLPLRQHRGAICQAKVEPGQQVGMGQVLGSSDEFDSAVVLSPVSGTVEAIRNCPDPAGQPVPTIVIANDGQDIWATPEGEVRPPLSDPDEVAKARPTRLLRRIREAGLVRAASQGLPLHVDLSPPMAPRSYLFMTGIPVVRPTDTLVIRALDHDPPVCPNQAALAGLNLTELDLGVTALKRISGAARVILALPAGAVASELTAMARLREWEIRTQSQTHFPYCLDNLMVLSLTGREVPMPYGEPRDVGVVVEPLVTALEVGRVLLGAKPNLERVFAVAGDVVKPQAFTARLGTPIAEAIKAAGGGVGGAGKIIVGGPMMGFAHFDAQTPITKETEGVFVQAAEHVRRYDDHPCIHCGRCVASCPVNLVPAELSKLCEFQRFEEAAEADLFHCIECGVCAYVCPARRPMVHYFRHGKSEVLARRMEE